jgi:hypothetical protein
MYISGNDPNVSRILNIAKVRGKTNIVEIKTFSGPITMNSYWDGGSKKEFVFVNLETFSAWGVPISHPYFDRKSDGERCENLQVTDLPENICLVVGGIFCGKPASIIIYLREENRTKLLSHSDGTELTTEQKKALNLICTTKGGQYRKDEFIRAGLEEYGATNPHILFLRDNGLLKINKAGSISVTIDGRNVNIKG